jgi:NhaP-type Na+/H+ or K+/H+ antiporter
VKFGLPEGCGKANFAREAILPRSTAGKTHIIVEEAWLPGAQTIVAVMAVTVALSVLLHGVTSVWLSDVYTGWYAGRAEAHHQMEESRQVRGFHVRRSVHSRVESDASG